MNLSIFDSLIVLTFIKTFYELADNRRGSFFYALEKPIKIAFTGASSKYFH